MPLRSSSDHSVKQKKRITNREIWSSVMDEIASVREDLDYLKTITQNTFFVMQRIENQNMLASNNLYNPCQYLNHHSHSQHICQNCEPRSEGKKSKRIHAVKSLINIENQTSVTSVSFSSADSSIDSLLTSVNEQKTLPDITASNL